MAIPVFHKTLSLLLSLLSLAHAQMPLGGHSQGAAEEPGLLTQVATKRAQMFEPEFWEPIIDDFAGALSSATMTKAHLEEAHRDHQDTGALRSGQGSLNEMN